MCAAYVAKFIGKDCSEDTLARVVHATTHAEMVRYHSKFVSRGQSLSIGKMIGEEPPSEQMGRVRKDGGRSGDGRKLPPEICQYVEEQWQQIVTAKLGFRNLKEMRDAWQKEIEH